MFHILLPKRLFFTFSEWETSGETATPEQEAGIPYIIAVETEAGSPQPQG